MLILSATETSSPPLLQHLPWGPDGSLAAECSHLPILGCREETLTSPTRHAAQLSLTQGHVLFYLKVITSLLLPKKSTFQEEIFADIFPLHSNFHFEGERKHSCDVESGTLLILLLGPCLSHKTYNSVVTFTYWGVRGKFPTHEDVLSFV